VDQSDHRLGAYTVSIEDKHVTFVSIEDKHVTLKAQLWRFGKKQWKWNYDSTSYN
jgi:hypothetical protein